MRSIRIHYFNAVAALSWAQYYNLSHLDSTCYSLFAVCRIVALAGT